MSSLERSIKDNFFTGLLALLPIAIIVAFFVWVFNIIGGFVRPILALVGLNYNLFFVIIVLIIILLLVYIIGALVRTPRGKKSFSYFEQYLLNLIPGYKQVKSLVDSFSGKESSKNYHSVVLVDVFKTGTLMTGFVTDKPSKDFFTVFVPTGPNPTSGMIYHVKKSQIVELDVSPQKAFESIIAVGKDSKKLFDGLNKK